MSGTFIFWTAILSSFILGVAIRGGMIRAATILSKNLSRVDVNHFAGRASLRVERSMDGDEYTVRFR